MHVSSRSSGPITATCTSSGITSTSASSGVLSATARWQTPPGSQLSQRNGRRIPCPVTATVARDTGTSTVAATSFTGRTVEHRPRTPVFHAPRSGDGRSRRATHLTSRHRTRVAVGACEALPRRLPHWRSSGVRGTVTRPTAYVSGADDAEIRQLRASGVSTCRSRGAAGNTTRGCKGGVVHGG